jgi:hypothetical protein
MGNFIGTGCTISPLCITTAFKIGIPLLYNYGSTYRIVEVNLGGTQRSGIVLMLTLSVQHPEEPNDLSDYC